MVGLEDTDDDYPFTMNILGEYNIGGDAWEIDRILESVGIRLISTFSGDVTYHDIAQSHNAKLNVVMCHRSINYLAEMMETKFGIPWFKVNFVGAESTAKSVKKIARYFEDPDLITRVDEMVETELAEVKAVLDEVRPRLEGKRVMLFVGGSRAHHYQMLFGELGMEVVAAGYEFAHRDDYEGRQVIPTIKTDADSQNIETLQVEADPERYRPRKTEEERQALSRDGVALSEYEGIMADMPKDSLVIDDISHHEMERLIEFYKPAVFCSGIKDKYVVQKMGVPCKQLHNYDYGGPYAGFKGAINFYREIDRMVNSSVWTMIQAPWEKSPQIRAEMCIR